MTRNKQIFGGNNSSMPNDPSQNNQRAEQTATISEANSAKTVCKNSTFFTLQKGNKYLIGQSMSAGAADCPTMAEQSKKSVHL